MPEVTRQFTLQECRDLLHVADDAGLWPAVSAFLFRFQEQIDPKRLEIALEGVPRELLLNGTTACRTRLAKYLQEKFGIVPVLHDFPQNDGSRLLLFPTQWYRTFGERIELLAQAKKLRSLIRKEDVLQWQERYPGVYPEILRRTAFYVPWLPKLSALPAVPHAGLRLLTTILQNLPKELLHRQMLRFPVETEDAFLPFDDSEWHREETDMKLLATITKHEFTQEYPLCF